MLESLVPKFAEKMSEVIANCKSLGIIMKPWEALRSPLVQAAYWKQGRDPMEIKNKIDELYIQDLSFIARCLEISEIREGNIITNALPGCSWHQWGEAIDCVWVYKGEVIWNVDVKNENGVNGYFIYAREAKNAGLNAGLYWDTFVDAFHVQYRSYDSPLSLFTLKEINRIMALHYSLFQP